MRRASVLVSVIALGALLSTPGQAAHSNYGRPRQIKVCNLLVPSTARVAGAQAYLPLGQNRSPHLFYVLDRRTDLKPEDWEFVNPLAPPVLNQAQIDRWARSGGIGLGSAAQGRTFAVGAPLTKDMAPYWEVTLSPENLTRLKEMDIVYISADGQTVSFTINEREMLRRLADAGVLVWIDNAGDLRINNNPDAPGDLFIPLDFSTAGGGELVAVDPGHPLLNGPFRLTSAEIAALNWANPNKARHAVNMFPERSGPERVLQPVVGAGAPSIAAARFGSGFVVASAGNIGRAVSWLLPPSGGTANNFAFSGADITLAQNEDMKLVYNMVAWTAESPQYQRVPRHQGQTSASFNGMIERWSYPAARRAVNWIPPLLSRELFIGALPEQSGFSLHALETEPFNDYDGDGNPDDGPAALRNDLSRGAPYDEIGRVNLSLAYLGGIAMGEKAGQPFLFAAGAEGNTTPDAAAGVVYAIPAPTPGLPTFGNPLKWGVGVGGAGQSRTLWAPPVYANSLLFASGGYPGAAGNTTGAEGIVRALDITAGGLNEIWHYPPSSAPTSIGPIVSPPIVANVEDSRTGAVDQVLFFTSVHSAASPGGLGGIVMSTRGEPLQVVSDPRTWAPGRRTEPWDPQSWWDIRVVNNSTGQTEARYIAGGLKAVEFNVDNQPGRIRLPDAYDPALYTVVADYTLSGTPDAGSRVLSRRYWLPAFTVPGATPTPTGVAGGAALGTDDTVYYATGNGYVAAAQFVGGIPVLKWKARTANANSYTGLSNVVDPRDPQQFADYQFVAAPAVGDDMVYFVGRDGVVYAFETTSSFTMKVPSPNVAGQPSKLPMNSARGANLIVYSNEATQPRTNRVPPDSYIVNADSGTVTITNFRNLTLDLTYDRPLPQLGGRVGMPLDIDYIDVQGNQVQDTCFLPFNLVYKFSAAQFGGGASAAKRFSTSPVIAGDRVYIAGDNGVLYDLPTDPRKEDPAFIAGADLAGYRRGALVHAREVSTGPLLAPPVVGNGIVAMATAEGLTAFHSPRVNVADGNRIVEVGADSTALSATDATEKHQIQGSEFPIPTDPRYALLPANTSVVTKKEALNRPAVVRRLNRQKSLVSVFYSSNVTEQGTVSEHSEQAETSTLVADTGNNRIVEFNTSGKVIWEAASFQDPWRMLPTGESMKLDEPHDVQRWVDTAPDPDFPTGPPLLVFHTLIADTGNRRVVELVDKVRFRQGVYGPDSYVTLRNQVDLNGEPVRWYHVLVWCSQTNAQGLRLAYRTAQRVPLTDANEVPLRNGLVPAGTLAPKELTVPPYVAPDRYQSATLCSVQNTQVWYDNDPSSASFRSFTQRNIPLVRPGADTILFLRSNLIDPAAGKVVPVRAPDPETPDSQDRFIYVLGTIDPTLPLIREIWDYSLSTKRDESVHTLTGISSLQRTVRYSRYPDPASGSFKEKTTLWYLVADAGGVFEFRFDPTLPAPAAGSQIDRRVRLGWAFTNDDYNWVTGGGAGNNRAQLRVPGSGPDAGRYVGGRSLTAASAQRLTSGQVLIVSRTTSNPDAQLGPQGLGGDIFTLRVNDYDPTRADRGWIPDRWVQISRGALAAEQKPPSITWRAPAARDPSLPPNASLQGGPAGSYNPLEIGGTYTPEQPAFADLVF
jgi:hypothetical protein